MVKCCSQPHALLQTNARLYLNGWPAFAQFPWLRGYVLPDGARSPADSMQGSIEAFGFRDFGSAAKLVVVMFDNVWHLVHVSLMLYSWTQPKSPFLLIAYAYRFLVANRVKMSANCCLMTCCENPTFIWQDLNSLLIRESEALREVPSDPTTETTAKFELCPRARGSKYMVQISKMVL